jgi:hypothetical protein
MYMDNDQTKEVSPITSKTSSLGDQTISVEVSPKSSKFKPITASFHNFLSHFQVKTNPRKYVL